MMRGLATAAAQHPWRAIGGWIAALLVSLVLIVFFLGDALTGEAEQLNNPESQQAYDVLERVPTGPMDYTSDVILIRSEEVTTDDPRFDAAESEVRSALLSTPGVVNVAQEPAVRRRNAVLIEFGLEDEEAAENVIDQVLEGVELEGFELNATGEW